jgi:hypothetical protein
MTVVVYPRTFYTDLDKLRLLAGFGEAVPLPISGVSYREDSRETLIPEEPGRFKTRLPTYYPNPHRFNWTPGTSTTCAPKSPS